MLNLTFAHYLASAPYGGGLLAGLSYVLYLVFWFYALFHIFIGAQQGKTFNVRKEVIIATVISAICSLLYFFDSIQRGKDSKGFGVALFLTIGWIVSIGVFYVAYHNTNERAKLIENGRGKNR